MAFNLGKMPLEAVLPVAERNGVGTRDDWADGLGKDPSVVYRAFNAQDPNYFITFRRLPELCVVMQSDLLLRWAQERFAYLKAQANLSICAPLDISQAFNELARLAKEVGEYSEVLEKASRDGRLDARERRQMKRELADIMDVASTIMQGLEALDEEDGK